MSLYEAVCLQSEEEVYVKVVKKIRKYINASLKYTHSAGKDNITEHSNTFVKQTIVSFKSCGIKRVQMYQYSCLFLN